MKSPLKQLIEQEVTNIMESFRGFSLAVFKKIDNPQKRIEYAVRKLPVMGYGSSRSVFSIGAGKVLKMAGDYDALKNIAYERSPEDKEWAQTNWLLTVEKGYAQNKAEVEAYTDPKAQLVLAKIFDTADDYSWIVAEAVKPLTKKKDQKLFSKQTGLPLTELTELLELYKDEMVNTENLIRLAKEINMSRGLVDMISTHYANRELKSVVDVYDYLAKEVPKKPLFKAMIHVIQDLGHMPYDIGVIHHWGKTTEGRIVLLDYGYNDEVFGLYNG